MALVRLSGARAVDILDALTSDDAATSDHGEGAPPARSPRLLRIEEPGTGELLDRALVTIFRGPHSYTGEDMVEISCHGGWLVPSLVLEAGSSRDGRFCTAKWISYRPRRCLIWWRGEVGRCTALPCFGWNADSVAASRNSGKS